MTAPPLILADADATTRLGLALARMVRAGDCICLEGPLGAGKTHLARTVIQSLQRVHGLAEDIPSPTYTLVQTYDAGDLTILHADLYRLGDTSELAELGLIDMLGTGLCLIEWPGKLEDFAPPGALWITLSHQGDGRGAALAGWPEPRLQQLEAAYRD